MAKNMDVLIVEPGKAPRQATIPNTLEAVETVLGGEARVGCFLPQRVLLFSREGADGLEPNRWMPDGKGYISGTFLLCGVPEEGCCFGSLSMEQRKKFGDVFSEARGSAVGKAASGGHPGSPCREEKQGGVREGVTGFGEPRYIAGIGRLGRMYQKETPGTQSVTGSTCGTGWDQRKYHEQD